MKFPLAILDFEASSLGLGSYPIEVGVAVATSPTGPVLVWSTLIRPIAEWEASGDWDQESSKVHGISRSDLAAGRPVNDVAADLSRVLQPLDHAWCDGGRYDGHWLARLYRAARMKAGFYLWDIAGLFAFDRALQNRFADLMATGEPPHRAGADAAAFARPWCGPRERVL